MAKITFAEWLNRKYVEWRGDAVGRDRSLTEFARYIGVSQQLLSDWMSDAGKVPKHKDKIDKLVAVFGYEVYDVLELERPDPDLIKFGGLDEDEQGIIRALIRKIWNEKQDKHSRGT